MIDRKRLNITRAKNFVVPGAFLATHVISEVFRTCAGCKRLLNSLNYPGIG